MNKLIRVRFYDNTQPERLKEEFFVDSKGLRQGKHIEYYETDTIIKTTFKNNIKDGIWEKWYNGKLDLYMFFKQGVLFGQQQTQNKHKRVTIGELDMLGGIL
jgi:antitoxin component YwqK of YwqJK toxin-antitoxin module